MNNEPQKTQRTWWSWPWTTTVRSDSDKQTSHSNGNRHFIQSRKSRKEYTALCFHPLSKRVLQRLKEWGITEFITKNHLVSAVLPLSIKSCPVSKPKSEPKDSPSVEVQDNDSSVEVQDNDSDFSDGLYSDTDDDNDDADERKLELGTETDRVEWRLDGKLVATTVWMHLETAYYRGFTYLKIHDLPETDTERSERLYQFSRYVKKITQRAERRDAKQRARLQRAMEHTERLRTYAQRAHESWIRSRPQSDKAIVTSGEGPQSSNDSDLRRRKVAVPST